MSAPHDNARPMTKTGRKLRGKFEDREAVVAVCGLGYVGLPLALRFAEAGFAVTEKKPVHVLFNQLQGFWVGGIQAVLVDDGG